MTTIHAGAASAAPAWDPSSGSEVGGTARPAAGQILSRAIAGAAAALGLAHIWFLAVFPHGLPMSLLLAAMVALCLKCAHRAWGRPGALQGLLAMSAIMAVLHTFMALGFGGHHHGGADPSAVATAASGAMLVIAAAELLLVVACSIGMRRAHAPGGSARYFE